jgi:hypothetical protein
MDPSRFRRKVLVDLIAAPWTLVPAALGASALTVAWGLDQGTGFLAFMGVTGLIAAVGAVATQWVLGSDKLMRRAFEALQAEDARKQEESLDRLDRRLQGDDDPRPEQCLRDLRQLYQGFKRDTAWTGRIGERSAVEIANKVEKLFQACIISLERSQELMESAARMKTPAARKTSLESRERLLDEVRASVEQLAHTIDGVQSLAMEKSKEQDLALVRQELDESLEVARRVEERMQTLEAELGKPAVESNRE